MEGVCRAGRAAGPSLALMLAAARADGVALRPGDCYRPADTAVGGEVQRLCEGQLRLCGRDRHVDAWLG